jgi:hypothetical protein
LPSSAGGLYSGGSAQMVENSLGIHGDEILYVGDHIYTDVSQSKVHLRWRTALICRELEDEVSIISSHWPHLVVKKFLKQDLFFQFKKNNTPFFEGKMILLLVELCIEKTRAFA